MRRAVQSILETYGYSPKGATGSSGHHQSVWDFFYKYLLPAIAIAGFGHWIGEFSIVIASAAYLLALAVFLRGFWVWCNTKKKIILLLALASLAVLAFAWVDGNWMRDEWTPTFLYLVPTHELIDCERRAFFVNHTGFKGLQNVEIVLKDNGSGAVLENHDFKTGIDPGPQDPDSSRYIWVKPSRPWDEDYTITVTATKFRSVQEIVLRSSGQNVQLATQIIVDPKQKPVLRCRDSSLPDSYSLGRGSRENCDTMMSVDSAFLSRLQPEFYGFQRPNGDFTSVRMRKLPQASDLDSQSEDRHLTEYQQTVMRSKLAKYRGTKLLVLYAGGSKTLAYATELRDFFRSLQWSAEGPHLVPVGDERIVDMQVSVSKGYWNSPYPRARDLMDSLEGLKHRQRYVYDDAITSDLIVLWVGPKSPDNFRPDDCAPAALRPIPGESHTCEVVAQTAGPCPFPPH
jgi:hypothetical protein